MVQVADESTPDRPGSDVLTFLIADVRGYTRFTAEQVDEAAAQLAATFARVAREVVAARGGQVIELRGDEALAVFRSTRQALRSATDLRLRFTQEVQDNPSLPLRVGIGLDAGEAVPVEGGYRGAALNRAARLCSLAGPGEVLMSGGVVHLAGKRLVFVNDDLAEGKAATIWGRYTSGTTGRPKGVMVHHRGAHLNALGEIITAGLDTDSTYLWTLPMFHCNGWCFPWAVVAAGGTQVCLPAFDAGRVWNLIREHEVTHLCGAPTVLIALANHPAANGAPLVRPLHIVTAAAPPSPVTIAQMEGLGVKITHVYGLTETYGPHTVCAWHPEWNTFPGEERIRLKSRQGVAYVIADPIRVADDDMHDVPADGQTMGEVLMCGNNVMKGYYRDPEATERAFHGGWFHSGDLGVMHPDGYIELRDRAKDIIISGGENIATIEVEHTILGHPAVLECAVVGVPDPYWGETPRAFVTLRPGMTVTPQEIIAFCRERIAHYKAPRSVEFGPLPKTSTGKIQKFILRDRARQEKEVGVGSAKRTV